MTSDDLPIVSDCILPCSSRRCYGTTPYSVRSVHSPSSLQSRLSRHVALLPMVSDGLEWPLITSDGLPYCMQEDRRAL